MKEKKKGIMKKILIAIVTLLVTAASTYGQNVTTFLGIPIDGSEEEMVCKLEEKGFIREEGHLLGKFYGRDAIVVPQSTNGLLSRLTDNEIMVANEEGKFYCAYNHKATQIGKEYKAIHKSDYICGDILICNDDEVR